MADKQGGEWPAANLVRHPPGRNGGVHRGPDKGIRRNVVRAIFMGALTDEGVSLEDLRRRRKHRKGMTLVPMAMVHHCKQAYKNIAAEGVADGRRREPPAAPLASPSQRASDRPEHVVHDERFRQHKPHPVPRELLWVQLISPARH